MPSAAYVRVRLEVMAWRRKKKMIRKDVESITKIATFKRSLTIFEGNCII